MGIKDKGGDGVPVCRTTEGRGVEVQKGRMSPGASKQ